MQRRSQRGVEHSGGRAGRVSLWSGKGSSARVESGTRLWRGSLEPLPIGIPRLQAGEDVNDASGNGASTTITGEAKPGPVYKYDGEHVWTISRTNLPGGMEFNTVTCIYGGQSVGSTMDIDATSLVGTDNHTYLRGEYQDQEVQGFTINSHYSVARQE